MGSPRDWTPPDDDLWERAADTSRVRRRTEQWSAVIRWSWVAAFVLVALAMVLGTR